MTRHPQEERLIAFSKTVLTEDYFKTLAEFIKRKYPGSVPHVLPKLRDVYAAKFGVGRGEKV